MWITIPVLILVSRIVHLIQVCFFVYQTGYVYSSYSCLCSFSDVLVVAVVVVVYVGGDDDDDNDGDDDDNDDDDDDDDDGDDSDEDDDETKNDNYEDKHILASITKASWPRTDNMMVWGSKDIAFTMHAVTGTHHWLRSISEIRNQTFMGGVHINKLIAYEERAISTNNNRRCSYLRYYDDQNNVVIEGSTQSINQIL